MKMLPRSQDDRDLEWLKLRGRGLTAEQIAVRYGVAKETVKVRTLEIRAADLHEAAYWGDDPKRVTSAYWSSTEARNAGRKIALAGIRKDGLKRRKS